jgi:hypothetical protein
MKDLESDTRFVVMFDSLEFMSDVKSVMALDASGMFLFDKSSSDEPSKVHFLDVDSQDSWISFIGESVFEARSRLNDSVRLSRLDPRSLEAASVLDK